MAKTPVSPRPSNTSPKDHELDNSIRRYNKSMWEEDNYTRDRIADGPGESEAGLDHFATIAKEQRGIRREIVENIRSRNPGQQLSRGTIDYIRSDPRLERHLRAHPSVAEGSSRDRYKAIADKYKRKSKANNVNDTEGATGRSGSSQPQRATGQAPVPPQTTSQPRMPSPAKQKI